MGRPSYEALKKRIQELEHESLERKRIEAELLAQQQTLRAQNIAVVRKSIDLSDIKRELEDNNYDLERVKQDLEASMAALRDSEARFRSLVETTSDWIWEVDDKAKYVYASPRVEDLLGYKPREIIGKTPFDFMPPGEAERVSRDLERFWKAGKAFFALENKNLHRNGNGVWLESSGVPLFDRAGQLRGYRGIDRDITDRKQAETALRESEQRYRSLVENVGIGVSLISPHMEILALNRQMKTWFPWIDATKRPICYRSFNDPPRDAICTYCPTYKTLVDGGVHEATTETPCGESISHYRIVSSPIKDKDGNIISAIEMVEDISERKRAEEELRASEGRFRELSEAAFEGIAIHDEGVLLRGNDQFFKMFRYSPQDLIGKQVLPRTVAKDYLDAVKRHVASGSTEPYEFVGLRKNGERFSVESRIRTMDYGGRKVRVAVMRDVTARRQFEQQLVAHREKLQFLASELSLAEERERRRVAAEVHDHIGQNLAFAKMKLTELRAASSEDNVASVGQITELVDNSIQDVRALVSELGSPVLYELGFGPAVEWLVQRMGKRHGIAVSLENDNHPKPLSDEVQVLLFQSVRELLANVAKHSQTIKARVSVSVDGDHIVVAVEDEGIGFDTTQAGTRVDKTAGFGLFSIQERLEPFGGVIALNSKPGQGARVTLIAPLERNRSPKGNKTAKKNV
jgi:PAS domain S-box-containing protein